ncbi:unnamed protein product [Adineta ricciae]|uniref:NAD(P)(+)--arginine ADP-ribosyltransferase n=1 Tax=Adineta ricciae TaxID=249248 RepID=A0A813RLY2_ADIRI
MSITLFIIMAQYLTKAGAIVLTAGNLRSTYMSVPTLSLMDAVDTKLGHATPGNSDCVRNILNNVTATLGLTEEEVATIKAYTANCLYSDLNTALRTENYSSIKRWFAYLKLFQLALTKLNAAEGKFCRGERRTWNVTYKYGEIITWWAVTSVSSKVSVCTQFLDGLPHSLSGTLYTIQSHTARSVEHISKFPEEAESILLPATSFRVISHGVDPMRPKTYTIDLVEIRSETTDTSTNTNIVPAVFTEHITKHVIDTTSGHSHLILPTEHITKPVIGTTSGHSHLILPVSKAISNNR